MNEFVNECAKEHAGYDEKGNRTKTRALCADRKSA